jgi:hypothetical protein
MWTAVHSPSLSHTTYLRGVRPTSRLSSGANSGGAPACQEQCRQPAPAAALGPRESGESLQSGAAVFRVGHSCRSPWTRQRPGARDRAGTRDGRSDAGGSPLAPSFCYPGRIMIGAASDRGCRSSIPTTLRGARRSWNGAYHASVPRQLRRGIVWRTGSDDHVFSGPRGVDIEVAWVGVALWSAGTRSLVVWAITRSFGAGREQLASPMASRTAHLDIRGRPTLSSRETMGRRADDNPSRRVRSRRLLAGA